MFLSLPQSVQPMHIPDGFLSTLVSIVFWVIAISFLALALRNVRRELGDRQVPLMGVLAAAIFAGQMLNFSISGGTSGHLLGAALATILVGPWQAMIIMTAVVSVQALIFQDGGVLALGANIFNMAVVGVFTAYIVHRGIKGVLDNHQKTIWLSGFFAAWTSIVVASFSCALQLALSGTSPAALAIPAMTGVHALIGIGEGLITVAALAFLYATRRDLLAGSVSSAQGTRSVWIGGIVIAAILAILSPLASSYPDGLEWVAEQHGFIEQAHDALYSIIPDYVMPGIPDEALATIIAGIVGILIVIFAVLGIAWLDKRGARA